MKRILKRITKELSHVGTVRAVILYGSFAREESTSRSDIDLFILTVDKESRSEIQNAIIRLESEIDRSIQPTIRTIKELQKTDTGLLQNIFQEGRILYLQEPMDIPAMLILGQKPYLIYTFKISSLSQKEKAKFNRDLYERKRRGYKYKGLLKELGGEKLASGCVMIPFSRKNKIEKLFKKFEVKYQQFKVWR